MNSLMSMVSLPATGDTTDFTIPIIIGVVAAVVIIAGIIVIVAGRKKRNG